MGLPGVITLLIGVITPLITGRGPPCIHLYFIYVRSGRSTPMNFPYNRVWENQPKSVGIFVGPHYKDSVIKGGMTIPNIANFDHGTYYI